MYVFRVFVLKHYGPKLVSEQLQYTYVWISFATGKNVWINTKMLGLKQKYIVNHKNAWLHTKIYLIGMHIK